MINEKLKRESKTIQYNSVWLAMATAMLVVFSENSEMLKGVIPEWAYLVVIMINSAVGIWLRTKTVEPVIKGFTKKPWEG